MAGGGGGGSIPAAARKMVQGLKEIVNCPEAEIYAMLKECGMDPDEAVNRLLSQDTFHEVKSKREKKKEVKEVPESRPRSVSNSSSHASRVAGDRGGRSISNQFSSNDYGVSRGKATNKKSYETGVLPSSSILGPNMTGNNPNQRATAPSEYPFVEGTIPPTGMDNGISSSSQPSSGFQQNWMGKPGHVSMADIVKMGKPQGKSSSASVVPIDTPYTSHNESFPSMPVHSANLSQTSLRPPESVQEFYSSQTPVSQVADISLKPGAAEEHNVSHNDWSLVEDLPAGRVPTAPESSGISAGYDDPSLSSSTLHVDEAGLQQIPHLDDIPAAEEDFNQNKHVDSIASSVTEGHNQNDDHEDNYQVDEEALETMISYDSERHDFEHEEGDDIDVETAATDLQNLRIQEEQATSAGNKPAVIIPSHLQVTNADCSHLSFGSFGSGVNAAFPGSYPSIPVKTELEVAPVADDASSVDQSDARSLEYYDNGQAQTTSEEHLASHTSTGTRNYDMPSAADNRNYDMPSASDTRNYDMPSASDTRNYDIPSASEPDIIRNVTLDGAHELQYSLPSVSGYEMSATAEPASGPYSYPHSNQQIPNLSPFSSLMQPRMESLPNSLLAPSAQTLREFDLPLSPLLAGQSVPTKYNTSLSAVSGPTISTAEVNPGVFSTQQPTPQTLPNASMPTGLGLPQHLPLHPYSQPSLPLGHFANMFTYPYLPQSYTYLPSAAFQQAYTGNGPFHQSTPSVHNAGMKYTLPQYKSGASVTSLPQSSSVVSGYGAFGNSANIPGSFAMNPSTAAPSTQLGFDDVLSMQYKEGNQYAPHQQTENPAMWLQGAGSRTMSALPSSTFYNFPGQNQHSGGYRQAQQPSHFGAMGYQNSYHSQAGAPQEHQQNPSEGNMSGSQGLPSQQSHQLWQHGY